MDFENSKKPENTDGDFLIPVRVSSIPTHESDLEENGPNELSRSLQSDHDTTPLDVELLENISSADVASGEETSTAVNYFNEEQPEPLNLPIREREGEGVDNWIKNKKKRERNEGRGYEYVSLVKTDKGTVNRVTKHYQARSIRPISCKCIYKCKETLRHENRIAVFDKYWKLGNLQAQRNFLAGLITKVDKKRMVVNAKTWDAFSLQNAYKY
ncbi:unnamed protein product [Phaedon cochleariae]|uniref:Uncharacterized protein n=1 Tax=Phaedon cochleariae TaxID=80249 RepID=A0A9N9X0P2_PHACE|nr:unnamed protein product [Phaedon cochleariae]